VAVDESLLENIFSKCHVQFYPKGAFLLHAGDIGKHSFFVEQGLLRQFVTDTKGKEHIIQFAPENWFMSVRENIHHQRPSNYTIQAMEDTHVFFIRNELLLELALNEKAFQAFNNKLLQNHIMHLQKRITQLLSASAEERYLDFIKIYPDLNLRVTQQHIASYLGITPESLSRVRKELTKKYKNERS
jgi:CRP-like cAMP-binding protein